MIAEQDATDFEALAKQSWQSFSTMKRFVSEAHRLENASWRLWFMQRHREPRELGTKRAENRVEENETEEEEEDDDEDDLEENENALERVPCVYCDLHAASLSCHGCCHDAYCVSCFKLVHKKGHLATHTAAKIQAREPEPSQDDGHLVSPTAATLSPPPTLSPDASRHHKDRSTRGKAKSWEIQMDMLLQRLMANSLHSDKDISVHNIDSRRSLDAADPTLFQFTLSDVETPTKRDAWSTDSHSSLDSSVDSAGPARVKSADLGVLDETAKPPQLSVELETPSVGAASPI